MPIAPWFRPPRHVLTLFLGVTGVLSIAMALLGWQWLDQDGRLGGQRAKERLESAGDAAAGAILGDLAALEEQMSAVAAAPAPGVDALARALSARLLEDAAVVVGEADRLTVVPAGRIVYVPTVAVERGGSPSVARALAAAEAVEQQQGDLRRARDGYRALTRSADSAVRAAALTRVAAVLAKLGDTDAALAAFAELGETEATVDGLPSGLVARYGRCLILRSQARRAELDREAAVFLADLARGRWALTRGEYRFYTREARACLATAPPAAETTAAARREALSDAVETAWGVWQAARSGSGPGQGRRVIWSNEVPFLLDWRTSGSHVVAVVAGPVPTRQALLARAMAAADRQRSRLYILDADGRAVTEPGPVPGALRIQRAASDTQLPWSIALTDADPGSAATEASRRRGVALGGLAALAAFVLGGSAFIVRAVNREAEVARLQTDFVAAVSHEFRTPLASLRQVSELLVDARVPSETRRADYYRVLQRESERLHRLVESLLDFGRMESGAREYSFAPTDVNQLVSAVVAEFAPGARDRGHVVETVCAPEAGIVNADGEALGRAVWNLLDNAVKYSPGCGTVWVETGGGNGRALIRVRDRGVGIQPAEHRAVFEKFRRGSSAEATRAKGTGLGLAMVRHIVTAHGGVVSIESGPGEGTTFTIELPATEDCAAGVDAPAGDRAKNGR